MPLRVDMGRLSLYSALIVCISTPSGDKFAVVGYSNPT